MSKPTDREVEQAFIDVQAATDGEGRRVMLIQGASPLDYAVRNGLADVAGWFTDVGGSFLVEPRDRIAALRNLELLARAYRLLLEHGVPA